MNSKKAKISVYKKNSLPYWMLLSAIAFEIYYTVVVLGNMATDYRMGVVIIANIIMIFAMFTCAVKVNVYSFGWAVGALALAAYVAARTLWLIPEFIQPTGSVAAINWANAVQAGLMALSGAISIPRIIRRSREIQAGKGR